MATIQVAAVIQVAVVILVEAAIQQIQGMDLTTATAAVPEITVEAVRDTMAQITVMVQNPEKTIEAVRTPMIAEIMDTARNLEKTEIRMVTGRPADPRMRYSLTTEARLP